MKEIGPRKGEHAPGAPLDPPLLNYTHQLFGGKYSSPLLLDAHDPAPVTDQCT